MNIGATLARDPATHPLVNSGQARIAEDAGARALEELRGELSTFVCEGQYADGMERILGSFIDGLGRTNQRGAWVSGFFGSGKSHLLKMLCHLWRNTVFPDGAAARSLVPAMPEELTGRLRELDVQGQRAGGRAAAAGSLLGGAIDAPRLAILAILLRAAGLPAQYPEAKFCLWLHAEGLYDAVKAAVEGEGRDFGREIHNLYVSGALARALVAARPSFAAGEAAAKQIIAAQFPLPPGDITTEEFLRAARDALTLGRAGGRLPCTLLILDETQQYIGDSNDRSTVVTEVAEAVAKQMDSRVMIVAAGQSALSDVPLLGKLMDRFEVRVALHDAEVESVTRKVLLRKKPAAAERVRAALDTHAGEISRQLQAARIGETAEDAAVAVEDYPLLPARRRFWEECFRSIDAAGTKSQLRSQLQILHGAVAALSGKPLGAVVPADALFDALAPDMTVTGVLPREIGERIVKLRETRGALAGRVCALAFLIGRLPRESGADTGVRASAEHIADLAIDDLAGDCGAFRGKVAETLETLAGDGVLMRVGGEYRLQTRQGAEWDRDFQARRARMNNDAAAVQIRRDELLYAALEGIVRGLRITQGAAREPRKFALHRGAEAPEIDGSAIPVWARDGWSASERDALDAARAGGPDDPTIHVFVPRRSADELRRLIVDADAARQTVDARGHPTEPEGREARQSMESRRAAAGNGRGVLVREIVESARVFQGGGGEALPPTLAERIQAAAADSLARLFPRFDEADSAAWPAAIQRARAGAEQPLQPVGHDDAVEKHAVCAEALAAIGAGAPGAKVRKALAAPPFGWPRDAADAALMALHRSRHLSATLNGAAVAPGRLDQNRIARAEFRVERAPLSIADRLAVRKLFQAAGVSCKSGEEDLRAGAFLDALARLARAAGGEPPLPAPPATAEIDDIRSLAGNERLAAIRGKADAWETCIPDWKAAAELAGRRLPAWRLARRLAAHAAELPEAKPALQDIAAIENERRLLDGADPAAAVGKALADTLRGKAQADFAAHERAHAEAARALDANETWRRTPPDVRTGILRDNRLAPPAAPEVGTDEALAAHLDRLPPPAVRAEIDAIPERAKRALEQAAKAIEPKVRPVALERATLRDAAEVEAWSARQKQALLEAVADGPVLIR